MKLQLILLAGIFSAPMAFAERPAEHAECKPLVEACEKAGFKVGHHKGKGGEPGGEGVWIDCIGAVANSKTVQGVTFSKEEADKCMAVKKESKGHKK